MLIVFFDIQGTVHKKFVPPDQNVNGKFYCELLKRLREGIRRQSPEKWKKNNWFRRYDIAPAHTSRCSTIPDLQKHCRDSPPPIPLTTPSATFSTPQDEITAERASF